MLLLIAKRRWPVLAAAGVTTAIVAIAITPFIDAAMWTAFPTEVRAFVARPANSVTAHQTTLGLMRHLCVADPHWNPSPASSPRSVLPAVGGRYWISPAVCGVAVVGGRGPGVTSDEHRPIRSVTLRDVAGGWCYYPPIQGGSYGVFTSRVRS